MRLSFDEKGWVKEGFVVLGLLMFFIAMGTLVNPQLKTFVGTMDNMAEDENISSGVNADVGVIYDNLNLVIPLFIVVAVVGIFLYFVASSLNTEHEYEVFSRIASYLEERIQLILLFATKILIFLSSKSQFSTDFVGGETSWL